MHCSSYVEAINGATMKGQEEATAEKWTRDLVNHDIVRRGLGVDFLRGTCTAKHSVECITIQANALSDIALARTRNLELWVCHAQRDTEDVNHNPVSVALTRFTPNNKWRQL